MPDRTEHDYRADPDALLTLAPRQGKGILTVFLGAAPGVGKTYAMLMRARRAKEQGIDIVVGLAETHGRSETADLLDGLEQLPRRKLTYREREIAEFDLDAALARRPAKLIVDELAHTNAPGSRHPKRYQDIEELLVAGIDVWTALNIQHLESLSDVVGQITGVTVREQVPDIVLKQADEVILIDLPPAELITRLNEGKVYLPQNAKRAAERYFRLGNLTALRDLALRRTADRVDDQVVDYLKQNAIEGPWLSAERLLVCIGHDALSEKVVRTASRLASGLNAHWLVVSVERASGGSADPASDRRLDQTFELATRLGAQTKRIKGRDFVDEIMKLARREHATQIVIGGRKLSLLSRMLGRSLPDAVMARAGGIGVHVVTADRETGKGWPRFARPTIHGTARSFAVAILMVALASGIGILLRQWIPLPNVSIFYLLAVLGAAIQAGYAAALLAALLSALSYNFFFIEPLETFTIAQPHEVVALFSFLLAALLAGSVASRLRDQLKISIARAVATQTLYDFSRKLSATVKLDDVTWVVVNQLQATLERNIAVLLPRGAELRLDAAWPPETELGVAEMAAARWAFERTEEAGHGTGTLPNSAFRFSPLVTPHGVVGVCGVKEGDVPLDSAERRTLGAILDQAAVAIDRARLSKASLEHAAVIEGGRFRSALLASVSHDLKTPLATITGAVTSLRQLGEKMSAKSRDDLLASIEEESGRLKRFLANLLDMTRIDAGAVEAKRDWVDVADVVHSAVAQAHKAFPARAIEKNLASDLPLIRCDSVLLGQVLFNLLDNANKFGGVDPVTVYARHDKGELAISVVDLGKGIPQKDIDKVFEKFFRRSKSDGRTPGTGLGLAIARGFVEAMGGTIRAESPARGKGGTRFSLRFPVEAQPATLSETAV